MKRISFLVNRYAAHPFMRASAIMFIGTMVTNVLAYLYHLVVGRILGPTGYGELAALLSIFYILNSPSVVIQNILVKFFSALKAKNELGQAKKLFWSITRGLFVIACVLFVLLIPLVNWFGSFLHITQTINLIWLYLMFVAAVFSIINVSLLQAFQQFFPMAVINSLGGVLRLVFGALGAVFGVGWTLLSNIFAGILTYAATYVPLKSFMGANEKKLTMTPMSAVYYSVPTFIAVFCITAIYSLDVVLVKHYFSAEEAGLYSSLSVLGKIIFFASNSLTVVAFPMLAERKELGKSYGKIVLLSLSVVACISLGITLVYYLFPSMVVNMLFGPAFAGASPLLAPFGLFISFFTLSNLFTTMFLALGKTSVWVLAFAAALIQVIAISLYHATLLTVIINNAYIAAGLFVGLLLYYPYVHRKS